MAIYKPVQALSSKSIRQQRNVFIWCTASHTVVLGWRVDNDSPITVSTVYRWITDAVLSQSRTHTWLEAERFTLFPVEVRPSMVLTYSVHKNGPGLSRESQSIIPPGDYGVYSIGDPSIYYIFQPIFSFSGMEEVVQKNSPLLHTKASLPPTLMQQAIDRDRRQCIFSGAMPSDSDESEALVATWVFPPFMGYQLSDDPWLESKYYQDPESCDLSELIVLENVVSGRKDIVTLFWENKLGVDVQDDYRIILFEGAERLNSGTTLKRHLNLIDGPHRPSDRFLGLHFSRCLAVSAGRGDVKEDYEEQEIENFMEELGYYDNELVDSGDPRWLTPLGSHVHAFIIREKLAEAELI